MAVYREPCSKVGGKTSRMILNLYSIPPPIRLARRLASGCPFGFALAIARTKAKDWLAYASASRLDPTPAVTVGHICAPSGLPQRPLPAPLESLLFNGVCLKKNIKKGIKKKKVIKRDFRIFLNCFWKEIILNSYFFVRFF